MAKDDAARQRMLEAQEAEMAADRERRRLEALAVERAKREAELAAQAAAEDAKHRKGK